LLAGSDSTYPPAVLFAVGLLFVILVLLHNSTVISRLVDQSTTLAQRLALLESRIVERESRRSRSRRRCHLTSAVTGLLSRIASPIPVGGGTPAATATR